MRADDGDDLPAEDRDTSYLDSPFISPEASAWLLKPLPRRPWRPPPPSYRQPKITKTDRHAWSAWEERGFTDVERDIWIEAGLGRFESLTAKLCRDAWLTPNDLIRVVDGRRVAQLLRSGEWTPSALAAYLKSESA